MSETLRTDECPFCGERAPARDPATVARFTCSNGHFWTERGHALDLNDEWWVHE